MQNPTSLARCLDIGSRPLVLLKFQNSNFDSSRNGAALFIRLPVEQPEIPDQPSPAHRPDPRQRGKKRGLVVALPVIPVQALALDPDCVDRLGLARMAKPEATCG